MAKLKHLTYERAQSIAPTGLMIADQQQKNGWLDKIAQKWFVAQENFNKFEFFFLIVVVVVGALQSGSLIATKMRCARDNTAIARIDRPQREKVGKRNFTIFLPLSLSLWVMAFFSREGAIFVIDVDCNDEYRAQTQPQLSWIKKAQVTPVRRAFLATQPKYIGTVWYDN